MSPTHTTKNGRRHLYYVSAATLAGRHSDAGSLPRIRAATLEEAVANLVRDRLSVSTEAQPLAHVARVEVGHEQLRIVLDDADATTIETAVQLKFRNGATLIRPEGHAYMAPGVDRSLVRALAMATAWAARLEAGEVSSIDALARLERRCPRYTASLLPLAYLAPDLIARIVEGRQPQAMTLATLIDEPLPLTWTAQRRRFAAFD